jgi:hypothetical protein
MNAWLERNLKLDLDMIRNFFEYYGEFDQNNGQVMI